MKNDTLLMHRLHGSAIGSYQSQGTNATYIFILRRAANSRNSARITCTTGATALLSYDRRYRTAAINHSHKSGYIQDAGLKKKLPFMDRQQNPRRTIALSVITERVIRIMFSRDGTVANNNTRNPGIAKINTPIEL